MNRLTHLRRTFLLISGAIVLAYFGFSLQTQAVVPPPDGGYPGFNTAEGQNALFSLTTGVANTAVGWFSLSTNTIGSFNTAIGAGALLFNVGDPTSGGGGEQNTAIGAAALLSNSTGFGNTANGAVALSSNTQGSMNTATGVRALFSNTGGGSNTANGFGALLSNNNGFFNTAIGVNALLTNSTGNSNTAVGESAGQGQTTGNGNVYIGADMFGDPGENDACYIRSIFGQTSASGVAVFINSANKLGTVTSSKRFKEEMKPMDKTSEKLFALKPVTFRYKKEIDPAGRSQFGLVAEEVEKVNPDLVVRDKEGKPYSVRYDQVNAMLLNEFLKAHREMQEQKAVVAEQQKQIEALTAGLQRVSARLAAASPSDGRLEVSGSARQTVLNNTGSVGSDLQKHIRWDTDLTAERSVVAGD